MFEGQFHEIGFALARTTSAVGFRENLRVVNHAVSVRVSEGPTHNNILLFFTFKAHTRTLREIFKWLNDSACRNALRNSSKMATKESWPSAKCNL